ncbi:hypothetical protein [Halomicrococcus sp. SG-WS-1]|uniref:hypothetical protein n=1 Tax=Halomicrococcus sp. SG-WS-1 TaxID=3439057 RepID=UPI003F7A5C71
MEGEILWGEVRELIDNIQFSDKDTKISAGKAKGCINRRVVHSGDRDVPSRVSVPDDEFLRQMLHDGNTYHSPTFFQPKAMLYHTGILTERGAEP